MYKTLLISTKPKGLCLLVKTAKFLNLAFKIDKLKQNIKIRLCVNLKVSVFLHATFHTQDRCVSL